MPSLGHLRTDSAVSEAALPAVIRVRLIGQPRLQKDLLLQFALCVLPLPPAFFLGQFTLGGVAFISGLVVLSTYHILRRRPLHFLCLLASSVPLLVFIRGIFIFFNSVVVLLGCGLACALLVQDGFVVFWKRKALLVTVGGSVVFWWVSYLLTGVYESNLRALEWSFCAAVVFMLSEHRSYLYTALIGWGISAATAGTMLLPYGDRLGFATIGGVSFGNPILLGLPAAFILLLSIAERGRWLGLETHPFWRLSVSTASGILLVFSTSRGSWIVAIAGLGLLLVFDSHARAPMLVSALALVLAAAALAGSSHLQSANHYLLKAISPETSMHSKTSGRIEQWQTFPTVFLDSPVWGFGPGSGRAVAYRYSGANLQWHSLYLLVGAEMGILGLSLLSILLSLLIRDGVRHFRRSHEIVPLLGTISFMLYGLSVSGFDSLGGMLLGLGFIGGNRANLWTVRKQWHREDPRMPVQSEIAWRMPAES
jgi:O-antigen ligase